MQYELAAKDALVKRMQQQLEMTELQICSGKLEQEVKRERSSHTLEPVNGSSLENILSRSQEQA
jgi:hypothetical protein